MAWWIFQNIVITTVLAVAVALICRTGRIGPVARHALWVLVLIKFVTPPLVVWPWAVPDPFGIAAIDAPAGVDQPTAIVASQDVLPASARGDSTSRVAMDDPASRTSSAHEGSSAAAAAWPWLLGLWAAGSLCVFGIEGVRLVRLTRRIRVSVAAPAGLAIVNRVGVLAARLNVRPVPVVIVAGAASPVVWGFGRPLLLWPAELPAESTGACIDGLIVHELAHVKRGDHLVGWIELAAGILWWWNPLFWFVRSALREQAELACDAWVISALPNGRRAYAESLLALSGAELRGASSFPTSMAAVGIRATSRRVLERRLVMIMKGRAPLRLPMVGLFCLALVGAATLPAWATAQQAPPPPPPPPVPVVQAAPPPPPVRESRTPPVPVQVRTNRQNPPPPPPPPPQPARAERQNPPPPPPPAAPTARDLRVSVQRPPQNWAITVRRPANLTPESLQFVDAFEKERDAIQAEADLKVKARHDAAVKALEDLQAQYAKAGKLDEAVAIRDYLRAGGPGTNHRYALRTIKR